MVFEIEKISSRDNLQIDIGLKENYSLFNLGKHNVGLNIVYKLSIAPLEISQLACCIKKIVMPEAIIPQAEDETKKVIIEENITKNMNTCNSYQILSLKEDEKNEKTNNLIIIQEENSKINAFNSENIKIKEKDILKIAIIQETNTIKDENLNQIMSYVSYQAQYQHNHLIKLHWIHKKISPANNTISNFFISIQIIELRNKNLLKKNNLSRILKENSSLAKELTKLQQVLYTINIAKQKIAKILQLKQQELREKYLILSADALIFSNLLSNILNSKHFIVFLTEEIIMLDNKSKNMIINNKKFSEILEKLQNELNQIQSDLDEINKKNSIKENQIISKNLLAHELDKTINTFNSLKLKAEDKKNEINYIRLEIKILEDEIYELKQNIKEKEDNIDKSNAKYALIHQKNNKKLEEFNIAKKICEENAKKEIEVIQKQIQGLNTSIQKAKLKSLNQSNSPINKRKINRSLNHFIKSESWNSCNISKNTYRNTLSLSEPINFSSSISKFNDQQSQNSSKKSIFIENQFKLPINTNKLKKNDLYFIVLIILLCILIFGFT